MLARPHHRRRRRAPRATALWAAAAAAFAGWPGSAAAAGGNFGIGSFARAKRELARIYAAHPTTLYSGCVWDVRRLALAPSGCPYQARRPLGRGGRIEWEHVVPAHAFGGARAAWAEGHARCRRSGGRRFRGRACASRVDPLFRRIEADMHNLFPEIGEVNQLRGSQAMGAVGGRYVQPGGLRLRCGDGVCEPPAAAKGEVARAYLYVDAAYPELGLLAAAERALFAEWSAGDPPNGWECERQARVAAVQGNINSFVLARCPASAP